MHWSCMLVIIMIMHACIVQTVHGYNYSTLSSVIPYYYTVSFEEVKANTACHADQHLQVRYYQERIEPAKPAREHVTCIII